MVDPYILKTGNYQFSNYFNKKLYLFPKGPLVLQLAPNASLSVQTYKPDKNKFHTNTTISGGGLFLGVQSNKLPVDGDPVVFGALSDLILANCFLNLYPDDLTIGFQMFIYNLTKPGLQVAIKYQNPSDALNDYIIPDVIVQKPVSKDKASYLEYASTLWRIQEIIV